MGLLGFDLSTLFKRSAPPASAHAPSSKADVQTALAFYSDIDPEKTKAMMTDLLPDASVTIMRDEPVFAPGRFMIYVTGSGYALRYSLNFKDRRLYIANLTNDRHDRITGRTLAGAAFAVGRAHGMISAGLNAGGTTGAYFWACLGLHSKYFDMGDVRVAIEPRVAALKKYQDYFDYGLLCDLAQMTAPSSLTRIAQMRDLFPFEADDFDRVARTVPGYQADDYLKCGILRKGSGDADARLLITPAKFALLGKGYYAEADLTDPDQAAVMAAYTGVLQIVVNPPTRHAGHLSSLAFRMEHRR